MSQVTTNVESDPVGQPDELAAQDGADEAQSQESASELPENLRNKSSLELAKMLQEQRSYYDRKITELKKEQDSKRSQDPNDYLGSLDSGRVDSHRQQQTREIPQAQAQEESFDFDAAFGDDPKKAIEKYISHVDKKNEKRLKELRVETDKQNFSRYYQDVVARQEDFSDVSPVMTMLADRYRGLISPDKIYDPAVAEILYLAARGASFDKLVEKRVKGKSLSQTKITTEKRKASQVESSNSAMANLESSDMGSLSDSEIWDMVDSGKISKADVMRHMKQKLGA